MIKKPQYLFLSLILFFLQFDIAFAVHIAPDSIPLLDRVMCDYVIPALILGLFGFIFVFLALIGRYSRDAWTAFCVFYTSFFLYLVISFVFWWYLKKIDIPQRGFFTLVVFCLTGVFITLTLLWHIARNRPKHDELITWKCPKCTKINTLTLTCYECGNPRVVEQNKS